MASENRSGKSFPTISGALDWKPSIYGTFPNQDTIIEDDGVNLSVLDAHLCEMCQGITWESLISSSGYPHYQRRAELTSAARDGCRLCLWICRALHLTNHVPSPTPVRLKPFSLIFDSYNCALAIQEPKMAPRTRLSLFFDIPISNLQITERVGNEGSSFDGNIVAQRLRKHATVESTLARFRSYLKTPTQDLFQTLPTRVLDVGGDDPSTVHLRDFSETPPKEFYVTLSHCWSLSKPLTTTKATLQSHKNGIKLEDLPPVFRDAILLTRGLQCRYLWIDSLTILQDSNLDWEVQSAKMGTYYSNSWLTLVAGLNAPESGLFGLRYSEKSVAGYYRLPLQIGNGSNSSMNLYFSGLNDRLSVRNTEKSKDGHENPIVRQRGWALQEEVLSSRFLMFEPRQTYLCLPNGIFHETGHFHGYRSQRYINMVSSVEFVWANIISEYSRRQLTYPMDKLPALSGLADQRMSQTKQTYAAGLWKESILHDLAWWVGYDNQNNPPFLVVRPPIPVTRPKLYRAPSWSWASIDGPIDYQSAWVDIQSRPSKFAPVIMDVSTTVVGKDPLGQVKDGFITLKTNFLFNFTVCRIPSSQVSWAFQSNKTSAAWMETTSTSPLVLSLDVETDFEHHLELKVWCLPLRESFSLILMEVEEGNDNVFKRVGAVRGAHLVSNATSVNRILTII